MTSKDACTATVLHVSSSYAPPLTRLMATYPARPGARGFNGSPTKKNISFSVRDELSDIAEDSHVQHRLPGAIL